MTNDLLETTHSEEAGTLIPAANSFPSHEEEVTAIHAANSLTLPVIENDLPIHAVNSIVIIGENVPRIPAENSQTEGNATPIRGANSLTVVEDDYQPILSTNSIAVLENELHPIHTANSLSPANDEIVIEAIPAGNTALSDVMNKVRVYEDGLHSTNVALSQIRIENDRMIVDHNDLDELALDGDGFTSLCNTVGAPPSYISRLSSELKARNLEYGLRDIGRDDKSRLRDDNLAVLSRDGNFVGFRRNDLYYLPATDVLDALRVGLGEDAHGVSVKGFRVGGESFALDLVGERLKLDVRPSVGDILKAGIHLEHSLLGDEATTISAYIIRLRCSNGATHRECAGSRKTRRTRRQDNKKENARILQYEQIKSLVSETKAKLTQKLEAIEKLQARKIRMADVERTFERFLRLGRLHSGNLMRLLHRAWHHPLGGDNEPTYFGILNAFTWLATHPAELTNDKGEVVYRVSDRQRAALSNLSGVFANQEIHICPACFSLVTSKQENGASHSEGSTA